MSLLAYNSSKSALNAIALHYANELRGTGILVNAAAEGATIVIELATLGKDGPTGTFKGNDGMVSW